MTTDNYGFDTIGPSVGMNKIRVDPFSYSERNRTPDKVFTALGEANKKYDNGRWADHPPSLNETIQNFVDIARMHKDKVTPEMMLREENRMGGNLDPACIFILRAVCGNRLFTDDVLQKVRENWCTFDLPEDLFDLLKIKDNEVFFSELGNYYFRGQEKTEAFVASGIMDQLSGLRKAPQESESAISGLSSEERLHRFMLRESNLTRLEGGTNRNFLARDEKSR